jgi:hypothetical protein
MRTRADRGGGPPTAVGILLAEHVLRIVRVTRDDPFTLTDAAELRLTPGALPDGRVGDVATASGLVRRLWAQLDLGFEPAVLAIGSPDVELLAIDPTSDDATRRVVERARWIAHDPADALVVLPQEESDGRIASLVALRSTVQAVGRAAEDAGIARPAVDGVPAALLRLARLVGATERIALVDGPSTWRVVLDPLHSELDTYPAVADPTASGTTEAPVLVVDGEPLELGDRIGDVVVADRVRAGFATAALAVPALLARQRLVGGDLAPDLRDAALSLPLGGHGDTVEDAGAAWRAEYLGPLDAPATQRRRKAG